MTLSFTPPLEATRSAVHHARAAAKNTAVAEEAIGQLRDALSGSSDLERILLKAAAGAGKSYVLKKLVADAIDHPRCLRVAVIAFQNRQLWPIATSLGNTLGRERVCLFPRERTPTPRSPATSWPAWKSAPRPRRFPRTAS